LDAAFLASQNRNLLLAALSALALSLLAAGTLSRHLLWPIRALGAGASQIAQGQLDTRIAVRGHDELGDLATTFNTMAQRLSDMEASRRDWIADTSHELRTPLAVLRAEIEALQDGVHSPDAPTLARLHRQTIQLTQLVDDLRLTLDREPGAGVSDFKLIDPMQVLADSVDGFHERFAAAGIVLDTSGVISVMSEIMMLGDAGRLQQVFDNLLENSLRYTNAGGRLAITIHAKASGLTLHFDDTAPAPPVAALPHLFDRFFRADASRNRALGGSGLGLSICKTLVQEQGGTIQASLSQLGGLSVTIFLPLQTL
jgi:two-component system sensor histidine kinase BaeS